MASPFRLGSMRTRIVLMNTAILAGLFGAIGGSLPPLVRATMLRSIDRDLQERSRRFFPQGPPFGPGPGDMPEAPPQPGEGEDPGGPPRPGNGGYARDRFGAPAFGRGNGPRGGRGGEVPPGPPEAPTLAGNVLRPRQIPVAAQGGGPLPPDPWDPAAFREATRGHSGFSIVRVGGEPVRVFSAPLPPRGPVEFVLQFPYPLGEVERAISGLTGTLLALAPLALLAAAAGSYVLTGRALRPVAQISRAAEQIGAEDLSRRIPQEGDDEFAQLAATFNGMLERLDVAFADRERLIGELRESVERQRRFTADASHELKTPLTAIKANTSLLLSGSPGVEDYREATREIDAAAAAMSRLVQDLLLLARSDAGQLVREPALIPLADPVSWAVCQARKTAAAPITIDVPPDIVVRGDEEALMRLFANLLDNAARHTESTGSITVRASAEDGWVKVEVEDTGSGIAPEHLPHLGERFYRVDAHRARAYGGTGLGLAICREIAAAHGGSLDITSEVGKGTTVTVRIPLAA